MSKDRHVELVNQEESNYCCCCCSTCPMNDTNQEEREWDSGFEVERIWEEDDD